MVSPSPAAPTGPLQPDTLREKTASPANFLWTYGFQLFALLLGLALAFL